MALQLTLEMEYIFLVKQREEKKEVTEESKTILVFLVEILTFNQNTVTKDWCSLSFLKMFVTQTISRTELNFYLGLCKRLL